MNHLFETLLLSARLPSKLAGAHTEELDARVLNGTFTAAAAVAVAAGVGTIQAQAEGTLPARLPFPLQEKN